MRELKNLHDYLFECFAYIDFRYPQGPERLWAIQEENERANQQRWE